MATIRKRGANTYQFTVSLGQTSTGKYKRKYKTYKAPTNLTNKQLERHLENEAYKFEQEVLASSYIAPSTMTFEQFSLEWQDKWLEKEVSENTIMLRLSSLNNHILPVLTHLQMRQISTLMLLDLMQNLTRKDGRKGSLSISAKQEIYKVLVSIFKRAEEWAIIKDNPMDTIKMPSERKSKSKTLNVYDENEVSILLNALLNEPAQWRLFMNIALATGLRRGEILGLEWKHIDFDNKTIFVEQILSNSRNGTVVKEPKNDSKRIISIPETLVKLLLSYKEISNNEKKVIHNTNSKYDWIFLNEKGTHYYPSYPTTWWRRFIVRLNKKRVKHDLKPLKYIRLHDLRHTSATLLISSNVHSKIISERLGHKKISTTLDIYSHVLPSADEVASQEIDNFMRT